MTSSGSATPLQRQILDLVGRHGPVPFSSVMESALYDPVHGFYAAAGGAAGRRGDFITSPEVGPLFGAVLARALDAWWRELGEPDPFVVVEGGAGTGTLAVAVLAAAPACSAALRYLLVERSDVLRARQAERLALADPAVALGAPAAHDGPVVASLAGLPATPLTGVVIANELLDNLSFDLLVRVGSGWGEVMVGLEADGSTQRLARHVLPASAAASAAAERFAPDAPLGAHLPWQRAAGDWVRDALALLEAGRVVIFDYAVERTAELCGRPPAEWLRTYRGHRRAGDPLADLGAADITVDVCADQLAAAAGEPVSVSRQVEFLRHWGIDDLVEEGKRIWAERAGTGDLAAVRARSRVGEAAALLDETGLGGFLVIEWEKS